MVRKKKLLLLSIMLLNEEMSNYVDRKRWTREWLKRREEKGVSLTIFRELAVEDTPGFAEFLIPGFADILLTSSPEAAILQDCY